ncbi:MAG: hypothetical protein M1831_007460 [Alyxoria varia]|nr:MAG: hypothetical protein M1831_007460 [Alyxoria varia]
MSDVPPSQPDPSPAPPVDASPAPAVDPTPAPVPAMNPTPAPAVDPNPSSAPVPMVASEPVPVPGPVTDAQSLPDPPVELAPQNPDSKDTEVVQEVQPNVTHEVVNSTEADIDRTVVSKDIHEDVYHTTVQPIVENKVLPEQQYRNLAPATEKDVDERDAEDLRKHLEEEQGHFKNERIVNETKHTYSVEPTVIGEHVHYHVHERVQPVVERGKISLAAYHARFLVLAGLRSGVADIHAKYANPTSLPPVSMSDYKAHGGTLEGRDAFHDAYQGEPRSDSGEMANTADQLYKR